jgi:cytochrome P450
MPPTTAGATLAPKSPPRSIRELPGPTRLPLVGNLLQIKPGAFHQVAEAWADRYGDLFRLYLGPKPMLAISNPEIAGALMRDRPERFGRGVKIERAASEMGIEGLFSANGDAWRRQRPMVMAALDPSHIREYFPGLVEVTRRLERRWRECARTHAVIDVQSDLMRYTVDVTAGLAFTLESDGDVIQSHLDEIFPMLNRRLFAPFPYWRYFKLPIDRRLDHHLSEVHKAVDQFIAAARARIEADPSLRERPRNLIEAMIVARDTGGSGLEDKDVAGNVLTMLLAGEDTTANTLAWMFTLLFKEPGACARLAAEAALLAPSGVPDTQEQAGAAVFAEACANEAMRIKPVAPFLFLEARHDTVVENVRIPQGGLIMLLLRRGANDSRYFAEPERFDATRWLGEERSAAPLASPKRVSMPFGAGPRLCPGRYLALLEIKMVTAMLFRNFEIEELYSEAGKSVPERLSFTMEPVGLRMRLKERTAA